MTVGPREAVYRLKTLGHVELRRTDDTEVTPVLSQPKRLALLIYLAVANRGALCRRDTVLGVFWPEFDQERARAALRKALHFLRRKLGNDVIVGRGDEEIGVDPDLLSCDANAFRIATHRDEFETSLGIYTSDFLDGFYIDDAPEFEQWSAATRVEFQAAAVGAAEHLARQTMEGGDTHAAIRWAGEWVRLAPTDEAATRTLMASLASLGERARAQQACDELARRLQELDLEPSSETQTLAKSLREDKMVDSLQTVSRAQHSSASFRRGPLMATAAVVAVIAAGYGVVRATNGWASDDDEPTVSVSAFTNLTDDSTLASVGAVYQRSIADGLAHVQRVRVLALGDTAASTLTVAGSLHRIGDSLEVTTEIVDRARGRTLPPPPPIRVPIVNPATATDEIRRNVMGALGYYTDLWQPVNPVRRPPNWEAYTTFQVAMYETQRNWGRNAFQSAADSMFRRVIELDSAYTEAYFWLGSILSRQFGRAMDRAVYPQRGLYEAMDSLVQTMRARVRPFTELDGAVADFIESFVWGDYGAAQRFALQLERLLPCAPNAALLAISVNGNRPRPALKTLATQRYSEWCYEDRGSWNHLMALHHLAGDYQGESAVIDSARAPPRPWVGWDFEELRARAALGDLGRIQELTRDLNLFMAQAGGLELRAHGLERNDQQLLAESNRVLRWAEDWYDEAPDVWQRKLHGYWFLPLFGRNDEVVANLEAMAQDSTHLVDVKGMLGAAHARQGNHAAAASIDRELEAEDPSGLRGLHTLWRARIAAQLGNKDEAVRLLGQAFREGTWFYPRFPGDGSFWHSDPDFEPLWGYPPYERLIAPKQ